MSIVKDSFSKSNVILETNVSWFSGLISGSKPARFLQIFLNMYPLKFF